MYKVLDLAEVGTGTTIQDLSTKDKKELKASKGYYEFRTENKLIEFAEELASIVGDDEEFDTAEEAIEYLDMMNYQVVEK